MGSAECSERIEVPVWYCVAAVAFGRLRIGHIFLLHSAIGDNSCLAFPVSIPPISSNSIVFSLGGYLILMTILLVRLSLMMPTLPWPRSGQVT